MTNKVGPNELGKHPEVIKSKDHCSAIKFFNAC